ncbi:MAG TPA: DUF1684 domain-containing protein [Thermomicrobiales bacterium]
MTDRRLPQFRAHKDHYFAHGEHSPLTAEQRERFTGLDYFDEDPALAFTVPLEPTGEGVGDELDLATTDGNTMPFVRAARVPLTIGGREVEVSVLRDLDRGRYFLPFRDETAGTETYELGRYLDPRERPDGTLVVDFNYAYNPYCAYRDGWSCPIPPPENVLPVRIEAGEKAVG